MPGLIRIAPPDTARPEPASAPLEFAQRWDSPYDRISLQPTVAVFLSRFAYFRITAHSESAEVEVGGVLTGQWCEDAASGRRFIIVNHMIPARHTKQGSVYLTFTKDTLIDLHERMENLFPGEKIVGWYHTHPRMGVFLSHYDTFLHNNFFPEPWQVALVVEPFSSIAGFFIRTADGTLDPTRYFGFYEMDGANGRRSVIQWQNMQKIENEYDGGTTNE